MYDWWMDDGEEGTWRSERGKWATREGLVAQSRPWSSVRYTRLGSRCYTARAGPDYSVFTTVITAHQQVRVLACVLELSLNSEHYMCRGLGTWIQRSAKRLLALNGFLVLRRVGVGALK